MPIRLLIKNMFWAIFGETQNIIFSVFEFFFQNENFRLEIGKAIFLSVNQKRSIFIHLPSTNLQTVFCIVLLDFIFI